VTLLFPSRKNPVAQEAYKAHSHPKTLRQGMSVLFRPNIILQLPGTSYISILKLESYKKSHA